MEWSLALSAGGPGECHNLYTPLALGLPGESVLESGEPPDESLAEHETQNILAFTNEHLLVKAHLSTAS